jgi:hypothetical protein
MRGKQATHPAPPLVTSSPDDVLREAEDMLAVMATRSLPSVAQLAASLCASARGAGAADIAAAADAIRLAALSHEGVALTSPMQKLTDAIRNERRKLRVLENQPTR